jgi:hypothetical protein
MVKSERKRQLGRSRHRWEDNVKMDLKAHWLVYAQPGLKFVNCTFCQQRAYICSGWSQDKRPLFRYSLQIGFYNRDGPCLLRGANRIFILHGG